ncbi:MAG TPA: PA14 domain-containing protein [Xanthobacteraceae bacterium]
MIISKRITAFLVISLFTVECMGFKTTDRSKLGLPPSSTSTPSPSLAPIPSSSRSPAAYVGDLAVNRRTLAKGGGFTSGGLSGQYFGNTSFFGTPLFTRADVRMDFPSSNRTWGGSIDPRFAALPAVGFSVRWTGQIVPAFSETYTLNLGAGGVARLYLRPSGARNYTLVVDTGTGATLGTYTFTAGQLYDVKVEYSCSTGPSALSLSWSSHSVNPEIIEPVRQVGLNMYPEQSNDSFLLDLADAMKSARQAWSDIPTNRTAVPADVNGWPLTDAVIVVWKGIGASGLVDGTYYLEFQGQANVLLYGPDQSTPSMNYNPSTNISSTTFTNHTHGQNQNFAIALSNTRRTPTSPLNSGFTNLKIMRPVSPGATTYFATNAIHYTPALYAAAPYTVLRFMAGTNGNTSQNWSDRTTSTYFTQYGPNLPYLECCSEGNQRSWEYMVMTANAMGKDLYLNIPEMASGSDPSDTTSYIYQLANLIRSGSTDSNGQYYPPLNPNLKVYVEYTNEVWNYLFPQWRQNFCSAFAALGVARSECTGAYAPGNPADAPILSFDGSQDANTLWNRRQALRLVQTSNIFRAVFGNAAMGSRARILGEFQYDNQGWPPTAQYQLDFIDEYFNNGDGTQHVSTPHPVNYYLWGAGGANYFKDSVEVAGGTETSISQIFGTCTLNALWPMTVDCTNIPKVQSNDPYQQMMNTEASWAARYGLYEVAYEGGWGLGGDSGGTAIENSAKYDPISLSERRLLSAASRCHHLRHRNLSGCEPVHAGVPSRAHMGPCIAASSVNCTEGTQNKMIQMFDLSGGGITVFGTYRQWGELPNFASSPLRQAVIDSSHFPRVLPSNGVRLPQTLGSGNLTLSVNANSMQISPNCGGNSNSCNSWLEWTVVAPVSGSYTLTPSFSTGGTAAVLVDGQVIGNATSGSGVAIRLTQGLHSIAVQALSGSFTVLAVAVT